MAAAIRCTLQHCQCDCFSPGKGNLRSCDSCKHGWVAHAMDKLGYRSMYQLGVQVEVVQPNIVFDIASLLLYGAQAAPIRLKILLDRLFSVLQHEEVLQVLHGFGWSYEDYARGYILQDSAGRVLDKWSVVTRDEEHVILQQFLRFGETKSIAQEIILGDARESHAKRETTTQSTKATSEIRKFLERSNIGMQSFMRGYEPRHFLRPLPYIHTSLVGSGGRILSPSSLPAFSPKETTVSVIPAPLSTSSPVSGGSPLSRLQTMQPQPYDYRREHLSPSSSVSDKTMTLSTSPHDLSTSHSSSVIIPHLQTVNLSQSSPMKIEIPGDSSPQHDTDSSADPVTTDGVLNFSIRDNCGSGGGGNKSGGLGSIFADLKVKHLRKSMNPMKRNWHSTPGFGSTLISPSGKKRVLCTACNKTFCDKGALKIHYSAVHLKEMHKCTVDSCNMMFSSRRSRNRHSANPNPKLHMSQNRRRLPEGATIISDSPTHGEDAPEVMLPAVQSLSVVTASRDIPINVGTLTPVPKTDVTGLSMMLPVTGRMLKCGDDSGLLMRDVTDPNLHMSVTDPNLHMSVTDPNLHMSVTDHTAPIVIQPPFYIDPQLQLGPLQLGPLIPSPVKFPRLQLIDQCPPASPAVSEARSDGCCGGRTTPGDSDGRVSTSNSRKRKSLMPTRCAQTDDDQFVMSDDDGDAASVDTDKGTDLSKAIPEQRNDEPAQPEDLRTVPQAKNGKAPPSVHCADQNGDCVTSPEAEIRKVAAIEDSTNSNNHDGTSGKTECHLADMLSNGCHGDGPYVCDGTFDDSEACSVGSDDDLDVRLDKENQRKCPQCGKLFQNHFGVKTHFQNVHLKLMHKCRVHGCNAAFPSKRSRDRHSANLNLHRKLLSTSSDLLDDAGNMREEFTQRIYDEHQMQSRYPDDGNDEDEVQRPNGQWISSAGSASPGSTDPDEVDCNHNGHDDEDVNRASPVDYSATSSGDECPSVADPDGTVACHICEQRFRDNLVLKEHLEKVHPREMYRCNVSGCEKVFSTRKSRNRHSQNDNLHRHLGAAITNGVA